MQTVCHGDVKVNSSVSLPYDFQVEKQTQCGPEELSPLGKSLPRFSRCQQYLRNESEDSMFKVEMCQIFQSPQSASERKHSSPLLNSFEFVTAQAC